MRKSDKPEWVLPKYNDIVKRRQTREPREIEFQDEPPEVELSEEQLRYNEEFERFAKRASVSLIVPTAEQVEAVAAKFELPKLYIFKLLLSLGIPPRDHRFACVARLIELCAFEPDFDLDVAVADFAAEHGSDPMHVGRIIDRMFNVYDPYLIECVEALTRTHPLTSKDVLCDIAGLVAMRFAKGGAIDE